MERKARGPASGEISVGSSCHAVTDGALVSIRPGDAPAGPLPVLVHSQFRAMILSGSYPCLGAASAIRTGSYRFGVYPGLGSPAAVADCAGDLLAFLADASPEAEPVAVLVAAFVGELPQGEAGFEQVLWRQLQQMRLIEAAWGGLPAPPPITVGEPDPGFPFGDREFFVVGLHPAASRWARRFSWPTLVFNALTHEGVLRRRGQYERMQKAVRRRDHLLQGSLNPSIERPQLAQFSGREVGADWQCPEGVNHVHYR